MLLLDQFDAVWFDGRMKSVIARIHQLALALAGVGMAWLMSGCADLNKEEKFLITIHAQGAPEDNPKSIFQEVVDGQPTLFQLSPQFSQVNIAAYHPFDSPDGRGKGVALKLDFRGASALEILTRGRQGETLLTKVNGRTVDHVTIDQPVLDGIFTIWGGVPEDVIREMGKSYPLISQSRSAARGLEMTPTTKKEKKVALERARKEKRQMEERAKQQKKKGKEQKAQEGEALPQAPTTNQIPIEGAPPPGPPPQPAPPANLPLPQ